MVYQLRQSLEEQCRTAGPGVCVPAGMAHYSTVRLCEFLQWIASFLFVYFFIFKYVFFCCCCCCFKVSICCCFCSSSLLFCLFLFTCDRNIMLKDGCPQVALSLLCALNYCLLLFWSFCQWLCVCVCVCVCVCECVRA